MAMAPRVVSPGLLYHVMNRGNNREIVFVEAEDYEKYLGLIYRFKKKYAFKLYAYCLMANHVHLLVQTSEKGTISKIMQSLTVAHTRHYHFKYQRCGHVWQGRFTSSIISDDQYMLNVMRYIEQNPLRANMVSAIGDYRWSSYCLNIRKVPSKLINREDNAVFLALGKSAEDRIKQYKSFLRGAVPESDLKEIRYSMRGGQYVSEHFREQIAQLLPKKRRRGRPSKKRSDEFVCNLLKT